MEKPKKAIDFLLNLNLTHFIIV